MKRLSILLFMLLLIANYNLANDETNSVFFTNVTLTVEQKLEREKYLKEYGDEKTRPEVEKKNQAAIKRWFESLKPLYVYGQVLDDSGNPIEGVKLELHFHRYVLGSNKDNMTTEWPVTDKDGCFTVKIDKGGEPHIFEIKKEGYEFKPEYSKYYSIDQTGQNNPLLSTSKDHPVMFRLRKKGETAFLREDQDLSFEFSIAESGKPEGADFIQKYMIRNLVKPFHNNERLVCDLQVQATFNVTNSLWLVVMKSGNASGGIIATEKLLYEAPQEGYQPEFTFFAEDRKVPKEKYIYLKSRNTAIYSRLDVAYIVASKNFIRIGLKSVTNPYGDRNLEAATDVPYEVKKQLIDKAKAAHRQGKHPEKPDLPKLIKEARNKAEKSKQ